jgi:hypothetical protein
MPPLTACKSQADLPKRLDLSEGIVKLSAAANLCSKSPEGGAEHRFVVISSLNLFAPSARIGSVEGRDLALRRRMEAIATFQGRSARGEPSTFSMHLLSSKRLRA